MRIVTSDRRYGDPNGSPTVERTYDTRTARRVFRNVERHAATTRTTELYQSPEGEWFSVITNQTLYPLSEEIARQDWEFQYPDKPFPTPKTAEDIRTTAKERQDATGYLWETLSPNERAVRILEELNRHPTNLRPDLRPPFPPEVLT